MSKYTVPVEELETGPDTTENINETHLTRAMSKADVVDFIANAPGLEVISIVPVGEDKAKILYRMNQDNRRNTKYEPDPENPNRMRKVTQDGLIEKYIDIYGNESDKPTYLSMPKSVVDRLRKIHGGGDIPSLHYGPEIDDEPYPTTEEMNRRVDEANKNVTAPGFRAEEKWVPKPGTKGMMKVQPGIFDHILEQMSDVHRRKNADYGDAAFQGYKEFGLTYYVIQLHNKLNRLKSLTKKDYQPQVAESIEDTLLDMANYAVLALEALKRDGQGQEG